MADTWGGEFIDDIRYGPQRSGAWHGEHETYGTEQQFIEGEKLQDLMPQDTSWGMRPTYANPVTEFIGENPLMNLAVDARGMLRQGGGPTGIDWAMLGLSGLPIVSPYAKTAGTALKRSIQDWGKRQNKYVDWDVDQHITATTDPTFKPTGFRDTLQGRILERLGMLPEYKDLNKPVDPMIAGWYDDYVLKGKSIDVLDDTKLFSPTERALYEAHLREGKTAEEAVEATLDAITSKDELIAEWLPGLRKSIDDNLTDWTKLQETTTKLPENIARLPGSKPIQDMTWREWDNLSDESFGGAHGKLSARQQDIMRAQGITNPDNILDHFWGKGARKEFVDALEQNVDALSSTEFDRALEFVRYRDLHSGYADKMTSTQRAKDIAWKEAKTLNIVDFPKIKSTRELSEIFDDAGAPPGTIENLVKFKGYDPDKALKNLDTAFKESRANAVAEKMSWKPDHISHEHWAQFTEKLTIKEVENAYRRLTLRLID